MPIAEILKSAGEFVHRDGLKSPRHAVITGGEPMLPREINSLCGEFRNAGFHITIETAGTIYRELECDLMSISPKLSNSDPQRSRAGEWETRHRQARHRPDVVQKLIGQYSYQLKFVVDTPSDLEEILQYLDQVPNVDRDRVLLMPQGVELRELQERSQWLMPICQEHGFLFCPRRHIEWFGNRRGT